MVSMGESPQTVNSVEMITKREAWGDLPIYAWGGSAGGTFVARLPYFLHLKVPSATPPPSRPRPRDPCTPLEPRWTAEESGANK